ncbi:MAG: NADH-quinone oxidoreductase subunit NuoB [Pseudomonadota bacterium]
MKIAFAKNIVFDGNKLFKGPFAFYIFGDSCCKLQVSLMEDLKHGKYLNIANSRNLPRESFDILVVTGIITAKSALILKDIYTNMLNPKYVISVGSCANSGGLFKSYNTINTINTIIPIDIYVPGCPPRKEAIVEALNKLSIKMKGNK